MPIYRKFYNDSRNEPENSLIFKITLKTPFQKYKFSSFQNEIKYILILFIFII